MLWILHIYSTGKRKNGKGGKKKNKQRKLIAQGVVYYI